MIKRTSDPADLIVDISTLSTTFMGSVAWRDISASGLLAVDATPLTLELLDALFAVRPAGYCGTFF